jgi:hypothetical protein
MYVFGSGTLIVTPFGSLAAADPTPLQLGTMQECSVEISASQKELYGKAQFPVAIARTQGKINMKAKFATFNAKILNDAFWGAAVTAGQNIVHVDFQAAASATVTIVAADDSAPSGWAFVEDLGVLDANGKQMTKHATPGVGQYSVAGAVYTFNAGETGTLRITYVYSITAGKASNVTNKPMGSQPVFEAWMANSQFGSNLAIRFPNCISTKISLPFKNEDFSVSDFDFAAFADGAGNILYEYLDE